MWEFVHFLAVSKRSFLVGVFWEWDEYQRGLEFSLGPFGIYLGWNHKGCPEPHVGEES